jgi:hypothetical protein
VDPYDPAQWHDFFVLVGSGSAALSGLVVVAMSLHLDAIVRDRPLRHRAWAALTGLVFVFTRCALVLMGGQSGRIVAVELFVVCLIATVFSLTGVWRIVRDPEPTPHPILHRTAGHTACYLSEMIGAVVLFLGSSVGLYIAAVAMVSNFYFMISGSWMLLVGISEQRQSPS